jgi:hypothetical protein
MSVIPPDAIQHPSGDQARDIPYAGRLNKRRPVDAS